MQTTMGKYNIQQFTVPGTVIVIATDDDAILTAAFSINGILRGIKVTAPALDDTDTFTIAVEDSDGFVLYSIASLAHTTKHSLMVDANDMALALPLSGDHKVRITANGAQAANRTFVVKLLVER
jgi:hypothetical protein